MSRGNRSVQKLTPQNRGSATILRIQKPDGYPTHLKIRPGIPRWGIDQAQCSTIQTMAVMKAQEGPTRHPNQSETYLAKAAPKLADFEPQISRPAARPSPKSSGSFPPNTIACPNRVDSLFEPKEKALFIPDTWDSQIFYALSPIASCPSSGAVLRPRLILFTSRPSFLPSLHATIFMLNLALALAVHLASPETAIDVGLSTLAHNRMLSKSDRSFRDQLLTSGQFL
jgi:hypothetical protein